MCFDEIRHNQQDVYRKPLIIANKQYYVPVPVNDTFFRCSSITNMSAQYTQAYLSYTPALIRMFQSTCAVRFIATINQAHNTLQVLCHPVRLAVQNNWTTFRGKTEQSRAVFTVGRPSGPSARVSLYSLLLSLSLISWILSGLLMTVIYGIFLILFCRFL